MQSNAMTIPTPSITPSNLSQADFREGMARLGGAVNIITTDGPAGCAGFTASAVCSVTDSPPTLLVCLNRSASVYDTFVGNKALCVNTLRPVHEQLSRVFGGKTPVSDRFAAATWTRKASGAPMLEGAAVAFDCRILRISDVGSHSVLFCEVIGIEKHEMIAGLIYFDRSYHRIFGVRQKSITQTLLPHDNRRWTPSDIERLRELAAANVSKIDIALALDRTSTAVEVRARKHGIKLRRLLRSHYFAK